MRVEIFNSSNEVYEALALDIADAARKAINRSGRFNFVLAGGSTPKDLYRYMASERFRDKIDWPKTFFFFGDERFVPEGDSQRNSKMADEALFQPLKIKSSQIFSVDTSSSPVDAAKDYTDAIEQHFENEPIHFDFILLGLGDDAHTASLFPHSWALNETRAVVNEIYVEQVDMYRITMSPKLINQAHEVAFLVLGKNKSQAVFHVLKDESGAKMLYPARFIKPENGKLTWYLDNAAAELL